jgi:hypothetical protein
VDVGWAFMVARSWGTITPVLYDARSRYGTKATRAAIKAPTQPNTTPAPTGVDGLFLRLMPIGYSLQVTLTLAQPS